MFNVFFFSKADVSAVFEIMTYVISQEACQKWSLMASKIADYVLPQKLAKIAS